MLTIFQCLLYFFNLNNVWVVYATELFCLNIFTSNPIKMTSKGSFEFVWLYNLNHIVWALFISFSFFSSVISSCWKKAENQTVSKINMVYFYIFDKIYQTCYNETHFRISKTFVIYEFHEKPTLLFITGNKSSSNWILMTLYIFLGGGAAEDVFIWYIAMDRFSGINGWSVRKLVTKMFRNSSLCVLVVQSDTLKIYSTQSLEQKLVQQSSQSGVLGV